MSKDQQQFSSFPFITSLVLLLVNDFILKAYFHNFITGKLSDFCGLFVFVIFWSVWFPKAKGIVFFSTALLFVIWKSPYSQGFINHFSDLLFPIDRVVDLYDLTALLILPFAWWQLSKKQTATFTHPLIACTLAIFSFCATSIAPPVQEFKLPQYVLFESSNFKVDTAYSPEYINDFRFHKFGNLVVVEVKNIEVEAYAPKADDYEKAKILKNLDDRLMEKVDSYDFSNFIKATGNHVISIKTADRIDHLNFSGTRLNGNFTRTDSIGRLLIRGEYRNGIEDGTWVFSDDLTTTKIIYKNGEAVRSAKYSNNKLVSSERLNTRADTVRNKCFQLIILLLLAIGTVILIFRNYKRSYPNAVNLTISEKIMYPFLLPLVVWILVELTSACLPDTYSPTFRLLANGVLSFILITPLFFIVFFGIKIRKMIDVLWYVLLFAFIYVLVQEFQQMYRLVSDSGY